MKKRIWFLSASAVTICILLVLLRPAKKKKETTSHEARPPVGNQTSQTESVNPGETQQDRETPQTSRIAQSTAPESIATPFNPQVIGPNLLTNWQAPIEFYGKVVDENSSPIAGAHISFHWVEVPKETGNRATNTESDAAGLFSLRGAHGPSLSISVNKEGYYSSRRDNDSASYGPLATQNFLPDPRNPVIFHLRKKGTPEPLIHIAGNGLRAMRDFLLAADGKPTEVSLRDGRLAPPGEGDLKVEFQAGPPLENFPTRITWQCRVAIPSGGLLQTDEEFPFLAPENGYEESEQWSVGITNWTETTDKQFYVKLRDGNFGRIKLRVIGVPQRAFFRMESFVNPSGSRNLESAK